ncbi:TPA: hypothetical protein EYP70_00405 [Candidatus Bathyarchaeota archaeon]|nr:hypothetical protein [Candidatus Bathyarchaeota archaeon]
MPEPKILEIIGADVIPVPIKEPRSWWAGTLPDSSLVLRNSKGRTVSQMPKGVTILTASTIFLRTYRQLRGLMITSFIR